MALCAWTINTSCVPGWDAYTPEQRETATDWATGILDALTGRQFAQCPVVIRPCGSACGRHGGYLTFPVDGAASSGLGAPWMVPYLGPGGVWRNCACSGGCSCRARYEARMPGAVAEVVEVKVDGAVLDDALWRLDRDGTGPVLVRLDGEPWPACQNMEADDTETDTWSVRYRPGQPLPVIGAIAAGELAGEFAKACAGSGDCALPAQLVSMSRNGVDFQVVDPTTVLENGLTGLANVDLFIRAVNPKRLQRGPRVLSPDLLPPRRVVGA